jgi:hypothetical protein
MAKSTVTIGCSLPHGIILQHPMDASKTVTLKGKNKAVIIGATHATTPVDGEFWADWYAVNKEFPAVVSGAIFVAKSAADAQAIAEEFKDRETGFEPMRTDGKDKRASGVKTAESKE